MIPTPPHSWKILAWIELIIGVIPSILIGSFLLYAALFTDNLLSRIVNEPGNPLLIAGIIALVIAIIGILAFKYLRRGENKGIWLSIIPKAIILVIMTLMYVQITAWNGSLDSMSNVTYATIYIALCGVIALAIYSKNNKNTLQ